MIMAVYVYSRPRTVAAVAIYSEHISTFVSDMRKLKTSRERLYYSLKKACFGVQYNGWLTPARGLEILVAETATIRNIGRESPR